MTRTITLTLPEDLYAQIEAQAQRTARPVDDMVAQTIARGLIAASDPDLAPAVQAELAAMGQLADAALRDVAGSTASGDTVALYDLLTQRRQEGTLTPEGQQWLERLRAEADLLMLRKAHAYALLKQRGQRVPTVEDLPLPRHDQPAPLRCPPGARAGGCRPPPHRASTPALPTLTF